MLFLANLGLGDDPTENLHVAALEDYVAQLGGSDAISTVCAVLEDELGQIECPDERVEFVPSAGPTHHRACLGLSLYLSPTRARCSAVLSSFFAFKTKLTEISINLFGLYDCESWCDGAGRRHGPT